MGSEEVDLTVPPSLQPIVGIEDSEVENTCDDMDSDTDTVGPDGDHLPSMTGARKRHFMETGNGELQDPVTSQFSPVQVPPLHRPDDHASQSVPINWREPEMHAASSWESHGDGTTRQGRQEGQLSTQLAMS